MFRKVLVGVICLAVVSGAFAQSRVSATEKGSLLVYPKVEVRWNEAGYLVQDTFVTLNNDYNGDVYVQLYFVNENCTNVDNQFVLTHNQPIYWAASTGEPQGVSPWGVLGDPIPDPEGSGDMILRGYIVLWAVDASGAQIRWNHLYGTATIVDYRAPTAWEYNAYSFPVIVAANGTPAQGAQVGTPGTILLNGVQYASGFQFLLLDFFASGSLAFSGDRRVVVNDTDLTLMILDQDLRQETTGPFTTKAVFLIWNEEETQFSGMEFCFTKFNEELLSHRGGHFLVNNLQSDKGRARINGVGSDVVCGPDAHSAAYSLLGVQAKVMLFAPPLTNPERAMAGGNLFGSGFMNATIQYDIAPAPPEISRRLAKPTQSTTTMLNNAIAR